MLMPLLSLIFSFFVVIVLEICEDYDWYVDAAVTVSFLFYFPVN